MVQNAVCIAYDDLRSLAFGGISSSYAAVGLPFANPPRMYKVTNLTDAALLISFNGVSDKDVIPANAGQIYDYGSNMSVSGGLLEDVAGRRVYVKQESGAATSGKVYVTVMYASTV